MFENNTYESILANMLTSVPNTLDKRQGSIIYDALAPAAIQLAQAYIALDSVLALTFASTTNGIWLEQRVGEFGIIRKAATPAVISASFNIPVPISSRFFINGIYYYVNSDTQVTAGSPAVTTANLICETAGIIGNVASGTLVAVNGVPGLTIATINSVLIPGAAVEADAALYARFLINLQSPATSGNKSQYELWAESIAGVGKAKVFPIWSGAGTVKIVIVDSNFAPPSGALVTAVQNYISPTAAQGTGVAPIGATVTVTAATNLTINVTANVIIDSSITLTTANTNVQATIAAYIKSIAFKDNTVRYSKIAAAIGSAYGILDYSNVLVNGATANITLTDEQLPVLGTVTVS